MNFVVEDGTGKSDATSYVSLDFATEYHENMGNSAWANAGEPLQKILLIRASSYADGTYARSWPGSRCSSTQRLDFPRSEAYDIDGFSLVGVPLCIKEFVCEAALVELNNFGELYDSVDNSGQVLKERLEGIISIEYSPALTVGKIYPALRRKLARILLPKGVREVLK